MTQELTITSVRVSLLVAMFATMACGPSTPARPSPVVAPVEVPTPSEERPVDLCASGQALSWLRQGCGPAVTLDEALRDLAAARRGAESTLEVAAHRLLCADPHGGDGLEGLALLAHVRIDRDLATAAALVADGLDRDPSSNRDAYHWLLSIAEDLASSAVPEACRERISARISELASGCRPFPTATGLPLALPLDQGQAATCRRVACTRCRVAMSQASVLADGDDPIAASRAYEALVFGDHVLCPWSYHAGEMAMLLARQSGDITRADDIARRLEERFPTRVTYLVHRDIVSHDGPEDPCY
jgi:hypothetical protein